MGQPFLGDVRLASTAFAPEEQHVYSTLFLMRRALRRSAMYTQNYISLLTERPVGVWRGL